MSEDIKPVSIDDINEFRKSYYQNLDFEYWKDRVFTVSRKYNRLKTDKSKAKHIVDIYSIYIQLVEILIIHINSLSHNPGSFLDTLAISNAEIKELADSILNNPRISLFVEEYVHKIKNKPTDQDQLRFDVKLLKECVDDYKKNNSFLNSFKHGYRLYGVHGHNSLSVGINNEMFKLVEGDSQLTYYEVKRKGKGLGSLHQVEITFKNERIFGKCLFIISILDALRVSTLLALGDTRTHKRYVMTIDDKTKWNESFGSTHFTHELFTRIEEKNSGL